MPVDYFYRTISSNRNLILPCIYIYIYICVYTGGRCDEKRVFEEVIEAAHYNSKVRPVHNSSHAVHVELEFELRQISSLVSSLPGSLRFA